MAQTVDETTITGTDVTRPPNIRRLLAAYTAWQPVVSSNVASYRYDEDEQTLQVTFRNGATYAYYGVPPGIVGTLARTSSPGRFVWWFLRDVYEYDRVSPVDGPGPNVLDDPDLDPRQQGPLPDPLDEAIRQQQVRDLEQAIGRLLTTRQWRDRLRAIRQRVLGI